MDIYISKVSENYENAVLEKLDAVRQNKIKMLKNEKEKRRSICAGALLYYAFIDAGYSKEEWNNVVIKTGEYGKPYIEGYDKFRYSISHSGDYVICAADENEIGADIQQMRPWKIQMAKRFFNEKEYERLKNSSDENAARLFYRIWAAKESAAKLTGRGIGAGISHLLTGEDFNFITDINENNIFNTKIYEDIDGYVISVCSASAKLPDRLKTVEGLVSC